MLKLTTTRGMVGLLGILAAGLLTVTAATPPDTFGGNVVLGRPTDRSVTVSVLAEKPVEAYVEYGAPPGTSSQKTAVVALEPGAPREILIDALKPDARYTYRLRFRARGAESFETGPDAAFHTQRAPGSTFTFGIQGDSHPERARNMYDAALYARTLQNVAAAQPDFYVTIGDDFSIDPLIARGGLTAGAVDQVYVDQRRFLSAVGRSAPLFLVNGNHEQAAAFLLNGTATSPPVLAGLARNRFFPLPAPDAFYTGDAEPVEFVGLRRDYYAWTWGDALFVVIDPYWHSPALVDAPPGGGGGGGGAGRAGGQGGARGGRQGGQRGNAGQGGGQRTRDLWQVTIGDAQYQWLTKTLEQSRARFKFVFAHHVLGTGRGAIELADFFEWGGKSRSGEWEFDRKRPGWSLPVHQLMKKTGVSAFFQGHDHLFAHQQRDGIVYQETPNPADPSYTAFNRDAYKSGDILPNSGFLRVTVSPAGVKVEYVRSYLPRDETAERRNGEVAFSYTITPGAP